MLHLKNCALPPSPSVASPFTAYLVSLLKADEAAFTIVSLQMNSPLVFPLSHHKGNPRQIPAERQIGWAIRTPWKWNQILEVDG